MGDQLRERVLDRQYLQDHPLPVLPDETDKNERGRVLVIGGSLSVPGGVRLTAEAALRAGAGKVRVGTVEPLVLTLGALFPEIAVLPLPVSAQGEIALSPGGFGSHLESCDAIVVGPAMTCEVHASRIVAEVLEAAAPDQALVVDAAALMALAPHAAAMRQRSRPAILTPHVGEMAAMLECDASPIQDNPARSACQAAERFHSVVALKGNVTRIAQPDGTLHTHDGGNPGLATGGSGDVLAGIAGGLLARGCDPLTAALWAVWLHGRAGRNCARSIGAIGYLARELLPQIPRMMDPLLSDD